MTDALISNGVGETLFVVTLWSNQAQDHTVAHIWASDMRRALVEAQRHYIGRIDDIRDGTAADLD